MVFIKTAEMIYKRCRERRDRKRREAKTNNRRGRRRRPGSSGHGLGLPEQPPQGLLPALPLQLCPDHLPAGPVVAVHPVSLRERPEGCVYAGGRAGRGCGTGGGVAPTSFCVSSAALIIFSWMGTRVRGSKVRLPLFL